MRMYCDEIIKELQFMASDKYKVNVVKMGIPENCSLGVSTGEIRKMAKNIDKSNELAYELWKTRYHEAKLLAVLLFDKKNFSIKEAEHLMTEVFSWDLCDHLCKNLIIKLKHYKILIDKWCISEQTYEKRAAFTLIASSAVHEKAITNETLDDYLKIISEHSCDEREHVKKAVSWALREIGKKDFEYQEKAVTLAYEWKEYGSKAQVWIAKDALKELENLVKAEGRSRLISSDSQMGRNS